MKKISILAFIVLLLGCNFSFAGNKFVGGDISELPTMEGAKAKYYDKNGNSISDLITYSASQGMNAMRVRLFVDPDNFIASHPEADPYACQSFDYILPICKRIKDAGMSLLLDFHYSDTWADPVKQYTPAAWINLNDEQLYQKIYEYTKDILTKLKNEGVTVDYIQPGNEISYGMCWGAYGASNSSLKKVYTNQTGSSSNDANLNRFKNLLQNAIKGCKEVFPSAGIVLHSERTPKPDILASLYTWAKNNQIEYDIIGISYYPYYHGQMSALQSALRTLESYNFGKDIWVVETGAPILYSLGDDDKQFYQPTEEDQNQFAKDLIGCLDSFSSVKGLFWWEMDYNAYPYSTTKLDNWYNASLFNNNTGKITSAFYTIAGWSGYDAPTESTKPENGFTENTNFYLLYNQGGDWNVPGQKFENNGDFTYSLKNVEMYKTDDDNAWFAITTENTTDWALINENRYGPSINNQIPELGIPSPVSQNTNSWQLPASTYNIIFNSKEMTLTLSVPSDGSDDSETDPTPLPDNPSDPGNQPDSSDQENPDTNTGNENNGGNTGDPDHNQQPDSSDNGDNTGNSNPSDGENNSDDSSAGGSSDSTDDNVQNPDDTQEPSEPGNDENTGDNEQPDSNDGGSSDDSPSLSPDDENESDNPDNGNEIPEETPGEGNENNNQEDTGIDSILNEQEAGYYDLYGRKVQNPSRGIFIRVLNGKREKVLISK